MKVIESIWFSSLLGVMGVVVGEDEHTSERKAYIGIGYGINESQDVDNIKTLGAKLSLSAVNHIQQLLAK